jgi:hypothetical protein
MERLRLERELEAGRIAEEEAVYAHFAELDRVSEENKRIEMDRTAAHQADLLSESLRIYQENKDKEVKYEKVTNEQKLAIAAQSIQATQKVSDLFFQWQINKHKGNFEKERELKKRQFQVNKALQIASTVVNTISSIAQAIGNNAPPLSWILAGINSAIGTAATVAIAAQKFDDGGGGSSGGASNPGGALAGTASISGAASTPQLNPTTQTSTQLTEEGSVKRENETKVQKVVLVETDVKDTTKRVDMIESRNTF